ncbi:hypothetical protein IM40_09665 (plasmid) [Candidatus Paracaedimonas acanthamoebae]|nr:hypothetical protein IM40_09665 [Candidatus Paracaedimonas acanthamoebae]
MQNIFKILIILGLELFFFNYPLVSSEACEEFWGHHPLKEANRVKNFEVFKESFECFNKIIGVRESSLNESALNEEKIESIIKLLPSCEHHLNSDEPWLQQYKQRKIHNEAEEIKSFGPPTSSHGKGSIYLLRENQDSTNFCAVKVFGEQVSASGASELANSLLASKLMISVKKDLNMAEIVLARRMAQQETNQGIYIIYDAAPGHDLSQILSQGPFQENMLPCIKGVACYLSLLHNKLSKGTTTEALNSFKTIYIPQHVKALGALAREKDDCCIRFKEIFNSLKEVYNEKYKKTYLEKYQEEPEKPLLDWSAFKTSIRQASENYRDRNTRASSLKLTVTHGDAHAGNFFYETEGLHEVMDHQRVTMIDYETMVRTHNNCGDPAEDVGRFLGGLWQIIVRNSTLYPTLKEGYETLLRWENEFIDHYLEKAIFDKDLIKANAVFFKLRMFRAILGNDKIEANEIDVKKRLFMLWMASNNEDELKRNVFLSYGL